MIHDISEFEHALSLVRDDIRENDFESACRVLNLLVEEIKSISQAFKNDYDIHLITSCNSCSDTLYNSRLTSNDGSKRLINAICSIFHLIENLTRHIEFKRTTDTGMIQDLLTDVDRIETRIKDAHSLLYSSDFIWAKIKGQKSKRKPKLLIKRAVEKILRHNINLSAKEVFSCLTDGGDVYTEDGEVCQDGEDSGCISFKTFENYVSDIKRELRTQTKNPG